MGYHNFCIHSSNNGHLVCATISFLGRFLQTMHETGGLSLSLPAHTDGVSHGPGLDRVVTFSAASLSRAPIFSGRHRTELHVLSLEVRAMTSLANETQMEVVHVIYRWSF